MEFRKYFLNDILYYLLQLHFYDGWEVFEIGAIFDDMAVVSMLL